jgi:hypothetical protein
MEWISGFFEEINQNWISKLLLSITWVCLELMLQFHFYQLKKAYPCECQDHMLFPWNSGIKWINRAVKPVNYYKGNICASSTVRKPRENGGLDFYYSRLEIGRFSCNFVNTPINRVQHLFRGQGVKTTAVGTCLRKWIYGTLVLYILRLEPMLTSGAVKSCNSSKHNTSVYFLRFRQS